MALVVFRHRFDLTPDQADRCFKSERLQMSNGEYMNGTTLTDELKEWSRREELWHLISWDWSGGKEPHVRFRDAASASRFKLTFL
jgi:hypothetical protein